jgi:hypothetical protein
MRKTFTPFFFNHRKHIYYLIQNIQKIDSEVRAFLTSLKEFIRKGDFDILLNFIENTLPSVSNSNLINYSKIDIRRLP